MIILAIELIGPMALSEAKADSVQMRLGPKTIAKFEAFILFKCALFIT